MIAETTFGRRGVRAQAVAAAPRQPVAAAPPPEPAAPVRYAELDGLQRLMADLPLLTFGLAAALWLIFRLQTAFALDVDGSGALSVETLVAQGADSFDLAIGRGQIWRLAMAPLLHASPGHLYGNLIAMVLVGVTLEPLMGRGWLLAIFALSGLGGEIASLIGSVHWLPGVGASGAITGMLAATLVMSFLANSPEDSGKMRRRALFFGVPALAPLLWQAHDHVNYFAHLGGALTGGGVALALSQIWDREYFRPPGARLAGQLALALLALAAPATAFAGTGYDAYRAEAAQLIPMREMQVPVKQLAAKAMRLQRDYPNDPTGRLLAAFRAAEDENAALAESDLRAVMKSPVPGRPWAERPLHGVAQGLLALVLKADRRPVEAESYARPLCDSDDAPQIVEALKKNNLCPA